MKMEQWLWSFGTNNQITNALNQHMDKYKLAYGPTSITKQV